VPQSAREATLKGFREGKFDVLVATDVAARGLDISGVELVVQCEPPKDPETYIHRSGRTGRAGESGVSVTLVDRKKEGLVPLIERRAGLKFERVGAPQPKDMAQASASRAAAQMKGVDSSVASWFLPAAQKVLSAAAEGDEDTELAAAKQLARALAVIAGCGKMAARSLLTAHEGFVTLHLIAGASPGKGAGGVEGATTVQRPGFAWAVLRRWLPDNKVEEIKRLTLTADGRGAVFDVPGHFADEFMKKGSKEAQGGRVLGPLPAAAVGAARAEAARGRRGRQRRRVWWRVWRRRLRWRRCLWWPRRRGRFFVRRRPRRWLRRPRRGLQRRRLLGARRRREQALFRRRRPRRRVWRPRRRRWRSRPLLENLTLIPFPHYSTKRMFLFSVLFSFSFPNKRCDKSTGEREKREFEKEVEVEEVEKKTSFSLSTSFCFCRRLAKRARSLSLSPPWSSLARSLELRSPFFLHKPAYSLSFLELRVQGRVEEQCRARARPENGIDPWTVLVHRRWRTKTKRMRLRRHHRSSQRSSRGSRAAAAAALLTIFAVVNVSSVGRRERWMKERAEREREDDSSSSKQQLPTQRRSVVRRSCHSLSLSPSLFLPRPRFFHPQKPT